MYLLFDPGQQSCMQGEVIQVVGYLWFRCTYVHASRTNMP